mgnify:CR=1 FL=1
MSIGQERGKTVPEKFTSIELCAGAGGQALGLELAGFSHLAAVENDKWACETLRANRDHRYLAKAKRWNVQEMDLHDFDGGQFHGVDLVAGGVPCPPFSVAGKQLGAEDDRDLFPKALEIVRDSNPKAVLLENVRGLSQPRFESYRAEIIEQLRQMGYSSSWKLLNSSDYGVPQLRPRFILVALKDEYAKYFSWPEPVASTPTVGQALFELMAANGWKGAATWAEGASKIAPTLVGGSKKHGGPDVGPTRARAAWARLGVKGSSIAEEALSEDAPVDAVPRLTVAMGGVIQGFPSNWKFLGGKTAAWRQVGNAFPPPVARAIGERIAAALRSEPLTEPHEQKLELPA